MIKKGEVHSIDKTGLDSNEEYWPLHAAIARAVGGTLRAFDYYQGPHITSPVGTFWLSMDGDYRARVWREDTDTLSESFPAYGPDSESYAHKAALSLLS
jgi:hypothetical protein